MDDVAQLAVAGSAPVLAPASDERPLSIELRHLAALAAIASEGSFWAAADRLGYVQSAVSAQLTQLEEVVGVRLVERSRGQGTSALTDAGRRLLERAERILSRLEEAQVELAALVSGRAGSIKVGMLAGVAASMWPRLIPGLARRLPEVEVIGSESASDEALLTRVARGDLELAVCEQPTDGATFGYLRLVDDPVVLLARSDSALASLGRRVRLDELADQSLIGPESDAETLRISRALRSAGIEPTLVAHSDLAPVITEAVLGGVGVALLPRLSVSGLDEAISVIELVDPPTRVLALAWLRERGRSAAAREFCAVAATAFAQASG